MFGLHYVCTYTQGDSFIMGKEETVADFGSV